MRNKSIRITPTGLEEAVSARADWAIWKLCKILNPDELQAYIGIIKERLKYSKDGKENLNLRRMLSIASDTYIIKSRNPSATEDFYSNLIYDIKDYGSQIFTILGFNNTDIYYEELNSICDMLSNNTNLLDKCKIYDEDIYSTVLISIIFDYYGTQYSEDELISVFDISLKEYLNLKIILSKWLIGNYWK
jgi:hypothetical protein